MFIWILDWVQHCVPDGFYTIQSESKKVFRLIEYSLADEECYSMMFILWSIYIKNKNKKMTQTLMGFKIHKLSMFV